MLGSELINKQSFHDFLEKTFINKDLAMALLQCFYKSTKKANLDKVMFLLYNEYFPVDMLCNAVTKLVKDPDDNTDGVTLTVSDFEDELGNIIDYCNKSFGVLYNDTNVNYSSQDPSTASKYGKNIYSHIKYDFFRNHVTTLTFKHYESIENYTEQLNVIYTALTDNEKDFLEKYLLIDSTNFPFLVRQQTEENKIDLAEVEKSDTSFSTAYPVTQYKLTTDTSIDLNKTYYKYENQEYVVSIPSSTEELASLYEIIVSYELTTDDTQDTNKTYYTYQEDEQGNVLGIMPVTTEDFSALKEASNLYEIQKTYNISNNTISDSNGMNIKYFDILEDGYYRFDGNNGIKKVQEYIIGGNGNIIRVLDTYVSSEDTTLIGSQCVYLLDGYKLVITDPTDITKCTIYGRPSIVNVSAILNLTNMKNLNYWYIKDNEKVASKRDMLISILNKISLGTIHY